MKKTQNKIERIEDEEFTSFLNYLVSVKGYSEKTRLNYGEDIADFLLFLKGENKSKEQVDKEVIHVYLLNLNLEQIDKSSIKRKLSALRHFYKYLYSFKHYQTNPFEIISSPKQNKRLPEFLSYEEVTLLLDSNQKRTDHLAKRDQAILELLFASGLRCSEIVSLRVKDIDYNDMQVRVLGKGNKERIVPFNDVASAALQDYQITLRQRLLQELNKDEEIFFLNNKGEPLSVRGLEYILTQAGIKAGFPLKIHPHMLRHTFATELLNNGADLRTIQEFLGHDSIRTTSIYTHVTYQDLKDTYQRCFPSLSQSALSHVETVIFDFNGTMFFDDEKHVLSWKEFAKKYFNREILDEEFPLHIHGFNNGEILNYLSGRNLTEEEIEDFATKKELIYQKICEQDKNNLHLVRGLETFLDLLLEKKITIGIATASRKPNIDWYFKTFSLNRWFKRENVIYDDGTLTYGKPHPMIYLRAMEKLHARKESTLVFEDSPAGIKSAVDAGVNYVVAIEEEKNDKPKQSVYAIINDFDKLPNKVIDLL